MRQNKEPRVQIMPEWVTMIEPLRTKNPKGWYDLVWGCTKEALRMIDKYETDDIELQSLYLKTKIIRVSDRRRTGQITVVKKHFKYGKKTNNDIA